MAGRTHTSIVVALGCALIASCASAPSAVEDQLRSSQENNAALWYWRCFNELQIDADKSKRYIALMEGEAEPENPDELRELRQRWNTVITTAEIAASKPICVFGIDREQGLDAMLPHLEPMRRLAKIIAGEADRAMERGENDVALRRIDTLCRMAAHTSLDLPQISTLVAISIANMTFTRVERWDESRHLSPVERQSLIDSVAATETIQPSLLIAVLTAEREMTSQWMLKRWDGPEDYDDAVRVMSSYGAEPITLLHPTELLKDLKRFDEQMVRLIDAARLDNASRLKQLTEDAWNGKHGLIARLLIIPYANTYDELRKVVDRRAALLDRLRTGPSTRPAAGSQPS